MFCGQLLLSVMAQHACRHPTLLDYMQKLARVLFDTPPVANLLYDAVPEGCLPEPEVNNCLILQGTSAFLAKDDAGAVRPGGFSLTVGTVIECVVTLAKNRRLVHVTADPTAVASATTKEWNGMTIGEHPCCIISL